MGRILTVGVAVLIGVLVYRSWHSTTFAADGTDASWDAAVRRSRSAGRPTVVLFTAGWCPYCQSLHGEALSRLDVQQEMWGHYSFYTVDLTDPSPQVQAHAQQCDVRGIPLMIRYDAKGTETSRAHYLAPPDMIAWLKAGE